MKYIFQTEEIRLEQEGDTSQTKCFITTISRV